MALLRRRSRVHAVLPSRSDRSRATSAKLTVLWRRPSVPSTLKESYPELKVSGNFRFDSDFRRRRPLRAEWRRTSRGDSPGNGRDPLGAGAFRPDHRRGGGPESARHRHLAGRRSPAPHPDARRVPLRRRREDGKARSRLRRRGPGEPSLGARARGALQLDRGSHRGLGRRRWSPGLPGARVTEA